MKRYYATCINHRDEEVLLVIKKSTVAEARKYIRAKYSVKSIEKISTTPPVKEKPSYYSSFTMIQAKQTTRRPRRGVPLFYE